MVLTPSSPRPTSRPSWWTTNGWAPSPPPCRASWTASPKPIPAESASSPNATPPRCRSLLMRWNRHTVSVSSRLSVARGEEIDRRMKSKTLHTACLLAVTAMGIYTVMQAIMDRVYTATNVARFPELLDEFKFGSSSNFPGAVAAPADPRAVHRVKINASCPKPFKHELMHQEVTTSRPLRRSRSRAGDARPVLPGWKATRTVKTKQSSTKYEWHNLERGKRNENQHFLFIFPVGRHRRLRCPLGCSQSDCP